MSVLSAPGRSLGLAIVAATLTAAGAAAPAGACSCGQGITLTRSYEAATWVVVAEVDSVGRRGDVALLFVTVEEQFKGPPVETLVLGRRSPSNIASCDWDLKAGERWLLFLAPEGDSPAPRWPTTCSGSLPIEADQRIDSDRLASHLAALRVAAEGSAAPPDPWLFKRWPGACSLRKPFSGRAAAGSFFVRVGRDGLVVDVRFAAPRQNVFDRAGDLRDLTVEIAGERHAIPRDEEWARSGGVYTVAGDRAERLLARLIEARPPTIVLSLEGAFATGVGTYGLASAAAGFEACRDREPLARAGSLEVLALPERNRDERLHFSWWVATATEPLESLFDDGKTFDWVELSAGDYIVTARCYGEQQRQPVRIVEGKHERLKIQCGAPEVHAH